MQTLELKTIISIVAIVLTFWAYIPYFRDITKGKTVPHVYTWFVWGLAAAITFGLQVGAGAGVGSWITLAAAIISFSVFILGMPKGKQNITATDTAFLLLSFVAIFLWIVVKQPLLSTILVTLINIFGFVPTVRKSWNTPFSETLFTYELNFARQCLTLLALQQYNVITVLYPASWVLANVLFSLMLIIRRKTIKAQTNLY